MTATVQRLNRLLPQTQCRECGYDGCLPYAQALAEGSAPVNLCAPGREAVMADIAGLLGKARIAPAKIQHHALAWIDETACIGCTACIRACPVDAIMGARKLMHTVIADECTGCGLCVAPCPVDCIHMQPVKADYLPQARHLSNNGAARFAAAEHAKTRYERHQARKQRDAAERDAMLAGRETAAKAMAKAQAQQTQLITPQNRDDFKASQLEEAKQRAAYRRAQRDMKYGSAAEKAEALEFLRRHKAEQEAKEAAAAK